MAAPRQTRARCGGRPTVRPVCPEQYAEGRQDDEEDHPARADVPQALPKAGAHKRLDKA